MKARMRLAAFFAVVLSMGIVLGLGYIAYLSYEKHQFGTEPAYHIVMREEYEVFPGDTFYLTPVLIDEKGEHDEGIFSYISESEKIVVEEDGKVIVGNVEGGTQIHIFVTEHKTQTKQEVLLHVVDTLSDVYCLRRNGKELSQSETEHYRYGESYSYTVSTLPEEANLEEYVSVECWVKNTLYPNAIDYTVSQNIITIVPKAIGTGEIEIKIQNKICGVDFKQIILFDSKFEDETLTKSVLQKDSFLDYAALKGITEIIFDESVSSVSLNGVTEGLPALRRIVFESDNVVNVTSNFPKQNICYRVPEKIYGQYLVDDGWELVADTVIPYFLDYHEIVVVYHTDGAHSTGWGRDYKVELYDGSFSSFECGGYEFAGWQTESGIKVTDVEMSSEQDGMHLYAIWNAKQYTVTFENFVDQKHKTLEVTYLEKVGSLGEMVPHVVGWEFIGWFFELNYEHPFTEETVFSIQNDITVYAKYMTRVKLDYDGLERDGDLKEILNVVYNSEISLPTVEETRDGWTFLGWFTVRGGYSEEGKVKQIVSQKPYTEALEDQTLYAVWQTELPYEYDRNEFAMLGWDAYRYIRGDSIFQSDVVTGDHLRTADELTNVLEGWNLKGLFTEQGDEISITNEEIRFSVTDVIHVVLSTMISVHYGHSGENKIEEMVDHGTMFELFRDEWGTAPESYHESALMFEMGYKFLYFTDARGKKVFDGKVTVDVEHAMGVYTANYAPIEYRILFDVSVLGDRVVSAPAPLAYTDLDRAGKRLPAFEAELAQKGLTGNWLYEDTVVGRTPEGMWTGEWEVPAGVFGDLTLIAQYTPNDYTVTFIGYDGQPIKDEAGEITVSVKYGECIDPNRLNYVQDRLFAPAGYQFSGWFLSDRRTQWTKETQYNFDQDINLYAKFEMALTFDMRINGSVTLPEGFKPSGNTKLLYTIFYGEELPLPAPKDESGIWDFVGWRSDAEISSEGIEKDKISAYTSEINCYYAIWTQEISLEIPYAPDKITPTLEQFTVYYGAKTFRELCTINQTELFSNDFFRFADEDGSWTFEGWYADETFTLCIEQDGAYSEDYAHYRIGAIYAKFTATVTFQRPDETAIEKSVVLGDGLKELIESVEKECAVKTGYELGWTLGGTEYEYRLKNLKEGELVPYAFGGKTLTAQEIPITYFVEFDANGGYDLKGGESKQTRGPYSYDESIDLPDALFLREGYRFLGWSQEGIKDVYQAGTSIFNLTSQDGETVILKAEWDPITYFVEFDANGGYDLKGGESKQTRGPYSYDESIDLPDALFLREGYRFLGWSQEGIKDVYQAGTSIFNLTSQDGETVTLKAEWDPIKYYAVYRLGVGEEQKIQVTYDDEKDKFPAAARFGYQFEGWEHEDWIYQAEKDFPDFTSTESKEIVFVAKWSAQHFLLSYEVGSTRETTEYTLDDWDLKGGVFTITQEEDVFRVRLLEAAGLSERSIYHPAIDQEGEEHRYWDLSPLAEQLIEAMKSEEDTDIFEYTAKPRLAPRSYTISFVSNDRTIQTIVYKKEELEDMEVFEARIRSDLPALPQKTGFVCSGWDVDALFGEGKFSPGDYIVVATFTAIPYTLELYDEKGESGELLATIEGFTFDSGTVSLPAESRAYALGKFFVWDLSIRNLENKVTTSETDVIQLTGSLRPYTVTLLESGSLREIVFTYRNLTFEGGEYYFDLTAFSACRVAVGERGYSAFTVYEPGMAKVRFDGKDLFAALLGEGESLYVFDAAGGELYDDLCGAYSEKTVIVSEELPQKFANGVGVHFPGHTFAKWETSGEEVVTLTAVWETAEEAPMLKTYTLHFQTEEGLYCPADLVIVRGEKVALPEVAKTGYLFSGWLYGEKTYCGVFDTSELAEELTEIIFVAQWTEIKYTVIFDGGEGSTVTKSYSYTQVINIAEDTKGIVRTGYNLQFWYDESGRIFEINQTYSGLTSVNGAEITLKAQWSTPTYPDESNYFIYYIDGAKNIFLLPCTEVAEQKAIELRIPERAGYTFLGWYNMENKLFAPSNGVIKVSFEKLFPEPQDGESRKHTCSLYAKTESWQEIEYTVTFRFNEREDKILKRTVSKQSVELPELTAPVRYGYTVQWNVPEFNYCDVVVYPEYVPIVYRVAYSAEGAAEVPSTQEVAYGNSEAVFASAEREGKVLVGWSYRGTVYPAGSVIPDLTATAEEITVVAVWRDYAIFFMKEEDGTPLATVPRSEELLRALSESTAFVSGVDLPVQEGYRIAWEVEEGTGDVRVLVRYIPIVFELAYYDGETLIETVTCAYGAKIQYRSAEKVGYLLKAWKGDGQTRNFAGDLVEKVTGSVTIRLTAEWEAITYSVEYDANGGDSVPARQKVTYDGKEVVFPAISRRGYTFLGWSQEETKGVYQAGDPIFNLTAKNGVVIRLKAEWDPIEYRIAYDTGCEIAVPKDAASSALYDASVTLPALRGREGYEFGGWNCRGFLFEYTEGGIAVKNLSAQDDDTVTLHAVWKAIEYKVIYYKAGELIISFWTIEMGASFKVEPLETGYVWSKDPNEYDPFEGTLSEFTDGDPENGKVLKLYAMISTDKQIEIKYTVNFVGEQKKYSETVAVKGTIKLMDVPYHVGYLGKWEVAENKNYSLEEDGKTLTVTNGETTSVEVTAQYTPISYTLRFDFAGGHWTNGETNPREFALKYDEELRAKIDVSRKGYDFKGWKNAADPGKNCVTEFVNLTSTNGDVVTLIADWAAIEYTLYLYDGIDHDLNEDAKLMRECTYGVGFVLGGELSFTREGYLLIGWQNVNNSNEVFAFGEYVSNLAAQGGAEIKLKALWAPIVYTVQYISDGGIVAEETVDFALQKKPTCPALFKAGYAVAFWAAEGSGEPIDFSVPLAKEQGAIVRVHAVWKPIKFTVHFDAGLGSATMPSCRHTYGSGDGVFAGAERAGYDFVGWAHEGQLYAAGDAIPDLCCEPVEITVHAVWTPTVYTVYFKNCRGEIIQISTFTVEDEAFEYPPLPEGCDSWVLEAAEGNVYIATPKMDTMYAVYYAEDETPIASRDVTGLSEEEIRALVPVPGKDGYSAVWELTSQGNICAASPVYTPIIYRVTFVDWNEETIAESSYTVEDYRIKAPAVPAYLCIHNDASHADRYITRWEDVHLTLGDITIHPVVIARVYEIEFRYFTTPDNFYAYIAAESEEEISGLYLSFRGFYRDDLDFILPEVPEIPRESGSDFVFQSKSWQTRIGGENVSVIDETLQKRLPYREDEQFVCFAWFSTNSYYIQYIYRDLAGGERELFEGACYPVQYGVTVEAPADLGGELPPKGHIFYGWFAMIDGKEVEVIYSGSPGEGKMYVNALTRENLAADAPIRIYTRWRASKYHIEVKVEGGSEVPSSFNIDYEDTTTTIGVTTRTGYTFVSWRAEFDGNSFTVAEAGKIGKAIRSLSDKNVPADGTTITLTAQWNVNHYTVKYNANGGNSTPTSQTVAYDVTTKVVAAIGRTGYKFTGWKSDKDNQLYQPNADIRNWADVDGTTITLTAQWTPITYTVKYDANGGSGTPDSQTVTYDSTATVLGGVSRSNYTFKGWKSSHDSKTYQPGAEIKNWTEKDGDTITLTAQWEENKKSCFAKGTMIALADGSSVAIENLRVGDRVLAFDHATGTYVDSEIVYMYYAYDEVHAINLHFSNNVDLKLLNSGHGLFDLTLNRYVLVTPENVGKFVGHAFSHATYRSGGWVSDVVWLESYTLTMELIERYDLVTDKTLNHVAEGMLACSDVLVPVCNIFDFGDDMKYDFDAMQRDIEEYGLFTYEEWTDYVTHEEFEQYNGAYFKVALGKGLLTLEDILALIQALENLWIR